MYICSYKSNLPYDNDGTSLIQEDIGDFKYGIVYESTKPIELWLQEWSLGGPVLNLWIVCWSEIQDGHHDST
jgi:hypothetical protein